VAHGLPMMIVVILGQVMLFHDRVQHLQWQQAVLHQLLMLHELLAMLPLTMLMDLLEWEQEQIQTVVRIKD